MSVYDEEPDGCVSSILVSIFFIAVVLWTLAKVDHLLHDVDRLVRAQEKIAAGK